MTIWQGTHIQIFFFLWVVLQTSIVLCGVQPLTIINLWQGYYYLWVRFNLWVGNNFYEKNNLQVG